MHRNPPAGERAGDEVGSAVLLVAEFRVGVEVAAQGGEPSGLRDDRIEDLHRDVTVAV
jgi:hypothetical protein